MDQMDHVQLVSGRFPRNSEHVASDASPSPTSALRVSAIPKPCIMKAFASYSAWIALIFATSLLSMVSAQHNFSIQGTSFSCSSNLICLGKAHVYNDSSVIPKGRLSLTQEGTTWTQGIAYYNEPIQFWDRSTRQSASFNTSFTIDKVRGTVYGSSVYGDGMAFVISADNSKIGAGGEYLGIFDQQGLTTFKSIIVEFDTFYNQDLLDINDNHVSFDFSNISAFVAAKTASDVPIDLGDEHTMYAWIEYSNQTQELELRVSNYNYRPVTPLLSQKLNFSDVVEEYMWVGFSSAAGDFYTNYYIGDWTFESNGIKFATGKSKPRGSHPLGVIVGAAVGISSALLLCIVSAFFVHRRYRGRHPELGRGRLNFSEDPMMQIQGMPEVFSYKQLSVATRAFSEDSKLGQGGFGSVYRGVLASSGIPVAVKKIKGGSSQGEKEFMAEVSIISQLRHRNLIQLIGWCIDASRGRYLLVYELMPNGSLDKALFLSADRQTVCLSWEQRFNIVTGTAAALDYLHQGWNRQVIHRDLKASNILLDEGWNVKLGDFGLARVVDHQRGTDTTLVAGTYGYMAPEVAASGKFTEKTDVFAFGAVVLEVACGRRALDTHLPEDEVILVDWVWQKLSEGNLMSTVDQRLQDYDTDWMEVMLIIGLLCSHPNPWERPTIGLVVQVLAGVIPVPSIPLSKPAFVIALDRHVLKDSSKSWSRLSKSRSRSMSLTYSNTSGTTEGSTIQ